MRAAVLLSMLVIVGVTAARAHADVSVRFDSTGMVVESTGSSPGRAIIEHFGDDTRNGMRIRQIGFGDPPIRDDAGSTCTGNPFANDVVCDAVRSFTLIGQGLADTYEVGGSNQGCAAAQAIAVRGRLGGGNDILRFRSACVGATAGINRLQPAFDVDGQAGEDTLQGGRGGDVLDGGGVADDLVGNAGNDQLIGGPGADDMRGSTGDDAFSSFDVESPDFMDGGSDVDSLAIVVFPSPSLSISLDGAANDGVSGEGDNVVRIENLETGTGQDRLVGSADANRLTAGGGDDEIVGADGPDTLICGDGNDLIEARDSGFRDVVDCGLGSDTVIADLEDVVPARLTFTDTSRCERIERFPVDDGPPGQVVTRRLAIGAGGEARLRLACPRTARVRCRGELRLALVPRRTLARARYAAALGRSATVRLRLSRRDAAKARRAGSVLTITRERGASKRGPRGEINTLRVR